MKKKILSICCAALALTLILVTPAAALSDTPYQGYIYDSYDKSKPAPVGYEAEKYANASVLGLESVGKLYDMDFDEEGNLYVLDSDKNSVYVLDVNLNLIDSLQIIKDGEPLNFEKAQGIFVNKKGEDKQIYIADTEHARIIVADRDGNFIKQFDRPDTTLIPQNTEFRPTKVVVSEEDTIYILCQHVYAGIVIINQDGEFLGFCGSNKVELTAKVLFDYAWKKLLSEEMKTTQARFLPVEYSGLDIDEEGFLLACSVSGTEKNECIRRLNAKGNNIFPTDTVFGDLETVEIGEDLVSTTFTDVTSVGDGIFAALDLSLGRVFLYDIEGSFLMSFGTQGSQVGTFKTPLAIASYNDYVFVLDQTTNSITKFAINDYGKTVLTASRSYLKGMYNESIDLWESVLVQNGAFETAYISIGRSLVNLEDYKGAMEYFKLGQSRVDYSRAFQEYRTRLISEWFDVIFIAVVVLAVGLFVFFKIRKAKKKKIGYDYEVPDGFFRRLWLSFLHPIRDMMAFVDKTKNSYLIAPFVAGLWFFEKVFTYQMRGFIFNEKDTSRMDIRLLFITSVGIFVMFIISNWLIATMFSFSGKLSQIATVTSLAITPYIVANIFNTILSNFLTSDEGMFLTIITSLAIAWGVVILFTGLSKIHEANFITTIILLVATVLGIFIIIFLILVFFSLWQQFIDFCTAVFNEFIGMLR